MIFKLENIKNDKRSSFSEKLYLTEASLTILDSNKNIIFFEDFVPVVDLDKNIQIWINSVKESNLPFTFNAEGYNDNPMIEFIPTNDFLEYNVRGSHPNPSNVFPVKRIDLLIFCENFHKEVSKL